MIGDYYFLVSKKYHYWIFFVFQSVILSGDSCIRILANLLHSYSYLPWHWWIQVSIIILILCFFSFVFLRSDSFDSRCHFKNYLTSFLLKYFNFNNADNKYRLTWTKVQIDGSNWMQASFQQIWWYICKLTSCQMKKSIHHSNKNC